MRKKINSAGLLWVLCMAVLLAACEEPREVPPPRVHAHHYDVSLTLDPERRHLTGSTALRLTGVSDELTLSFANLAVDSVSVNGRRVIHQQDRDRDRVYLLTMPGVSQDTVTVQLWYRGAPRVGLPSRSMLGHDIVYTEGWPDDVRGWLPGTHHPARPATLDLELKTPVGGTAVATGVLHSRDTTDATVTSRWSLSTPVPTYTFGFAFGPFEDVEISDRISLARIPDLDEAEDQLKRVPEAFAYFEELLGPYPFEEARIVPLPHDHAGMEYAMMPSVQADLLQQGESSTWTHSPEAVVVHEMAHQWAGNAFPIEDWRDLWLSEGMATYLTVLFYAHVDGPEAALEKLEALHDQLGGGGDWTPLYPDSPVAPAAHLTRDLYNRGALVLHALREAAGDEAFAAALAEVFDLEESRKLSTERLEEALGGSGDERIGSIFATYVYSVEVPAAPSTPVEPLTQPAMAAGTEIHDR